MIIQDFVILILFNRHLLLVMTLNIIHDIFSLSNVMHSKGDKFITFDIKFIGMGQVSILLGHALNNQFTHIELETESKEWENHSGNLTVGFKLKS